MHCLMGIGMYLGNRHVLATLIWRMVDSDPWFLLNLGMNLLVLNVRNPNHKPKIHPYLVHVMLNGDVMVAAPPFLQHPLRYKLLNVA